ncbi:peroxisomal acyl-coenzyme A oxidase 1-like isoform X2 [Branchiostoma floridae]|uniref:Acyl-coenzyme A oxidase n=1 Tax=Branchiostoma floridae TaxID=7739 RepID=A0A9J7HKB4_BRAFL|nr:peroxisomal acyl-coenzyme A oxidase 1-like isoform X2 [Branchiostoma floridae]
MATTVNPDLRKERENASFVPEKITNFLYGGPERVQKKRELASLALNDPDYHHEDLNFMSREQQYETCLKKSLLMTTKIKQLKIDAVDEHFYRSAVTGPSPDPLGLHVGMFLPTLYGQATQEQKEKWLNLAENYVIIGTYAQTEMGHGTFLRGLETTATFDPKTQEFILNTPTLTASKWWPGGLGKTSNYCVLMAQLYIQGKSYGPHPFMVQIRSLQDHKPLPGVTVGDIGPKFGYDVIDNGFLALRNVRIPRENMLMKHSKVAPDGTYVKPPSSKLAYGTMVFVRATIVNDSAMALSIATTIAIRYSCVRRQSEMKPGHPEPQVLDYVTQQYKLFPYLAAAYAFWLTGQTMMSVYMTSSSRISKGDISVLPELHALSAGLKALSSWVANVGMEECRLACGGHGYSHASGLPRLYANLTPGATYEGENTVMMLQTARYLMKSYNQSLQGEKLAGSVAYLSGVQPVPAAGRTRNMLDLGALCDAFRHRAARLVHEAAMQLRNERQAGKDQPDAWNAASVDLVKAAMAHSQYFVVKNFAERLTDSRLDSSISAVLTRLCQLHALHGLVTNSGDFLEDGYLTGSDIRQARRHINALMAKLRPDAVALVDAFDFPDGILNSILGRYDGNVYQHLLEWAKASPLNKNDLAARGSNYEGLMKRHKIHTKNLESVTEALRSHGVEVKVIQKHEYTPEKVNWADVIMSAGGDGTFLMAASHILT